jgi:hypothetical protein
MLQMTGCTEGSSLLIWIYYQLIIIIITTKNNQWLFLKRLHLRTSAVILPVVVKLNQSHKFQ